MTTMMMVVSCALGVVQSSLGTAALLLKAQWQVQILPAPFEPVMGSFLARAVAHLPAVLAHRITLLHGYHRGHLLFIDVVARPSYIKPAQSFPHKIIGNPPISLYTYHRFGEAVLDPARTFRQRLSTRQSRCQRIP